LTCRRPTMAKLLAVLSDGKPKSSLEIANATGLEGDAIWSALNRCWHNNLILRTKIPLHVFSRNFKGRGGIRRNLRKYHLYTLKPENVFSLSVEGRLFVSYDKSNSLRKTSKAHIILGFLKSNADRAYFATEIAMQLREKGVRQCDIMSNARRWQRKGLVLVRGYRMDDRQIPFQEGYLLVYVDASKPRDDALKEAIEKTEHVLSKRETTNPVLQRTFRIRDSIIESTSARELVSFAYLVENIGCSKYEAEAAINRALQLYPDLKELRLFNAFRYFYHDSLGAQELEASIAMKKNYIRLTKGRSNRIGHNWEAVTEWFIDKFTTGARFWNQEHRTKIMDPRRITIHLTKSVGSRRQNAEVDRVWEVTPGIFSPSVTYVLSCKWGIVFKRDLDDFFNVLRWSKEFGVTTNNGREIRQGVVGVFAASAFNPKENVKQHDDLTITLASYATRMNVQLLKASDFNSKLYQKGCPKTASVQKICKIATNEKQVRELLERVWNEPKKSEQLIAAFVEKNKKVYEFEEFLEQNDSEKSSSLWEGVSAGQAGYG